MLGRIKEAIFGPSPERIVQEMEQKEWALIFVKGGMPEETQKELLLYLKSFGFKVQPLDPYKPSSHEIFSRWSAGFKHNARRTEEKLRTQNILQEFKEDLSALFALAKAKKIFVNAAERFENGRPSRVRSFFAKRAAQRIAKALPKTLDKLEELKDKINTQPLREELEIFDAAHRYFQRKVKPVLVRVTPEARKRFLERLNKEEKKLLEEYLKKKGVMKEGETLENVVNRLPAQEFMKYIVVGHTDMSKAIPSSLRGILWRMVGEGKNPEPLGIGGPVIPLVHNGIHCATGPELRSDLHLLPRSVRKKILAIIAK